MLRHGNRPLAVVAVTLAVALGGTGAIALLGDPSTQATATGLGTADQPAGSASATPKAGSPSPTASAKPSPSKTSSSARPRTTIRTGTTRASTPEGEVLRLVNVERRKAGCASVHGDSRLATAARKHSQDMAVNDYFSHVSLDGRSFVDRIADAGYPRDAAAAENIAYGYGTAAAVMDAWMHSDGHRANILNCDIQALGVGLAYAGNGTPYWTQDFGRI